MGRPVFSDVVAIQYELRACAQTADEATTHAERTRIEEELSRAHKEHHDFLKEANELQLQLVVDGMTADQWFESLGSSWTDDDKRLHLALLKWEAAKEHRVLSPELQYLCSIYFPLEWPPI